MESPKRHTLLDGETGNTTGKAVSWSGIGPGTLQIAGTFDTATVTIEGSLDDGATWASPTGGVFTAAVMTSFEMGIGLVRAVLSLVGASTSLSVYLSPQERS